MKHWFDVLFYSSGMGREVQLGRRDPFSAVSLLLDADVSTYLHFGRDSEWPSLETAAAPRPEYAMAAALLLQATGASPAALLRQIIEDTTREAAERAIAIALLAAFLADSGAEFDAIAALRVFVDRREVEGVPLVYALIHLALRCIEGGAWDAAFVAMDDADHILANADDNGDTKEMLAQINASNRVMLAQLARGTFDPEAPAGGRKRRHRIDQLTAAALDDDLARAFNARFSDSGTRTVSFGQSSMSVAERCLLGAVLRAEAIGQFQDIVSARANLGRYVLASAAGASDRTPDSGFDLLLRAREGTSLEKAVRRYLDEGPIGSVARFVNALSARSWPPTIVESALKVVARAGDLLEEVSVTRLLLRLTQDYEYLVRPNALVHTQTEFFNALASVVATAAKDDQEVVARFCLSVSTSSLDGLTLQSLPRVLFAVDWASQPAEVIDQWIEFIRENLSAASDRKLTAEEAMIALADVQFDALMRIVRAERGGKVIIAALAIQSGKAEALTNEEVESSVSSLVAELNGKRLSASRGSFSWGSRYDSAALLASLLIARSGGAPAWDELIGFLTDAAVMRVDKEGALRVICERINELPSPVLLRLREEIEELSRAPREVSLMPSSASYNSTILRLGDALRVLDSKTTLHELIELLGAPDESVRLHAAVATATIQQIDEDALLTVILLLTRDKSPYVRAAAGRSLASRRWSETNHVALVWPRLTELLAEAGRAPVFAVLQGLAAGGASIVSLPRAVVSRIQSLATEHPSWRVRRSSAVILGSSAR